jgi:uncharacterized membrane protein YccC
MEGITVKNPLSAIDTIAKAVMAAGGLAITALQPLYGAEHWYVAAIAVYGALGVYFTKNLGMPVNTIADPVTSGREDYTPSSNVTIQPPSANN